MKTITIQFDEKLHATLKQTALDRRTSMRSLFDTAIRMFLKKEGVKIQNKTLDKS